jgi:hypothetical protein
MEAVVYDVRWALPGGWWLPVFFGLTATLAHRWRAASGMITDSRQGRNESLRLRSGRVAMVCLGIASAGLLASGLLSWGAHLAVVLRLAVGGVSECEGRVSDLVPGDPDGHTQERWTVMCGGRSIQVEYAFRQLGPGYSTVVPRGGAMQEGQTVRVQMIAGRIVRLTLVE